MDSVNGYLQLYATTQEVNANNVEELQIFYSTTKSEEALKLVVLNIGNVGLSNLGGGGLDNEDDASFNNVISLEI